MKILIYLAKVEVYHLFSSNHICRAESIKNHDFVSSKVVCGEGVSTHVFDKGCIEHVCTKGVSEQLCVIRGVLSTLD